MHRTVKIDKKRQLMGTLPEVDVPFQTPIMRGVEGILVDLVDAPENPYKAMYAMAVSTWGTWRRRVLKLWDDTPPEQREAVVRAVLDRSALPLAMEAPKFTFVVENLSRWSFDQIARLRLGTVFASMGTRDNCHLDVGFRLHEATWRDTNRLRSVVRVCRLAKEVYREIVRAGTGSWQEARTVLPISTLHRFTWAINYSSLRGFCGRRMTFSEAEDTVAVAWLLRDRMMQPDAFPLLGAYLRPNCDWAGACQYRRADSDSEAFGCLFASCGRNPVRGFVGRPATYQYASFNSACTDASILGSQIGVTIVQPGEGMPRDFELTARDRFLFGYPPRPSSMDSDAYSTLVVCGPSGVVSSGVEADEILN